MNILNKTFIFILVLLANACSEVRIESDQGQSPSPESQTENTALESEKANIPTHVMGSYLACKSDSSTTESEMIIELTCDIYLDDQSLAETANVEWGVDVSTLRTGDKLRSVDSSNGTYELTIKNNSDLVDTISRLFLTFKGQVDGFNHSISTSVKTALENYISFALKSERISPGTPQSFMIAQDITNTFPNLSWEAPSSDTISGYLLVRGDAINTPDFQPVDGQAYDLDMEIENLVIIYNGPDRTLVDSSVSNPSEYFYMLFSYDERLNYSEAALATIATRLPCEATVGGFCWYLGAFNRSCNTVCAAVGRTYDTATRDYAGSNGSNAQCNNVMNALRAPLNTTQATALCSSIGRPDDSGCIYNPNFVTRWRCTGRPTTGSAQSSFQRRACACQ